MTIVRCSATCTVLLSGKFAVTSVSRHGRHAKPRILKASRLLVKPVAAGKLTSLTFKLSKQLRKRLAAALAQHRRLTLTITAVATAPGMKSATAVVTIRLIL